MNREKLFNSLSEEKKKEYIKFLNRTVDNMRYFNSIIQIEFMKQRVNINIEKLKNASKSIDLLMCNHKDNLLLYKFTNISIEEVIIIEENLKLSNKYLGSIN